MVIEIDLSHEVCKEKKMWEKIKANAKCSNLKIRKLGLSPSSEYKIVGVDVYKEKKRFWSKTPDLEFICQFEYNRDNYEINFLHVSRKEYNTILCIAHSLFDDIDGITVKIYKNFC